MNEQNNSNKTMLIVTSVIVVVVIAGIAAFAFSNMNNNDETAMMSSRSSMTSEEGIMVGGAAMLASRDIVENVSNASNLTTLVKAVVAADLVDALKADGPLTVFGPDNAAFEKLPAGTVDTLLQPENKDMLANILTYHVVEGNFNVNDLSDGQRLTTLQGADLVVYKQNGVTTINGARITTPDITQKNGVAHVIDTVMMPPADSTEVGGEAMLRNQTIVENVVNAPNLKTLVAAVTAADLVETLNGPGPFTVFGPDNAAFAKLPAGTVQNLVKPENKEMLRSILTYHVVAGSYSVEQLFDGQKLETVNGEELTIRKNGNTVQVIGSNSSNVATITTSNVFQSNGVAHVIDTVLMPMSN